MTKEKMSEEELKDRNVLAKKLFKNSKFVIDLLNAIGIDTENDKEAIEMCTPDRSGQVSPQAYLLLWTFLDDMVPDGCLETFYFQDAPKLKIMAYCEKYNIPYKKAKSANK